MEGQGVVNLRPHSLVAEKGLHRVAPADPNYVLVEDVRGPGLGFGQDHSILGIRPRLHQAGVREKAAIVLSESVALSVPAIHKAELDQQNRRLQGVQPAVPTNFIMVVTVAHSMHTQEADAFCDGLYPGGDHAGLAGGTEVLGGVKAESRSVPQGTRPAPIPGGPERLRRVFDQEQVMVLFQQLEAVPVGGLAIEVNGQDRSNAGCGPQACFGRRGIQVEGLRIDTRKQRLGSGAQNGADGREKAECCGDNRVAGADARPLKRQPESIRARGTADGMGHAAFFRSGVLKLRHLGAHDEVLRGKNTLYGLKQQRANGAIFARKVQARHPQRGGIWTFSAVSHVGNVSIAHHAATYARNASKLALEDVNWRCCTVFVPTTFPARARDWKACKLSLAGLERIQAQSPNFAVAARA